MKTTNLVSRVSVFLVTSYLPSSRSHSRSLAALVEKYSPAKLDSIVVCGSLKHALGMVQCGATSDCTAQNADTHTLFHGIVEKRIPQNG
jgi:hypothetical protein